MMTINECIKEILKKSIDIPIYLATIDNANLNNPTGIYITRIGGTGRDIYGREFVNININVITTSYGSTDEVMEKIRDILQGASFKDLQYFIIGFLEINSPEEYNSKNLFYKTINYKVYIQKN